MRLVLLAKDTERERYGRDRGVSEMTSVGCVGSTPTALGGGSMCPANVGHERHVWKEEIFDEMNTHLLKDLLQHGDRVPPGPPPHPRLPRNPIALKSM